MKRTPEAEGIAPTAAATESIQPERIRTRPRPLRARAHTVALAAALATFAGAAAASDRGGACEPQGLGPLLTEGRIVLLGEIHGSEEAPALVAAAACAAAERGLEVVVALEIPLEEEERVVRFLASAGGADAREQLLAGDFWRRPYQDGRSSEAMLSLLEDLRRSSSSTGRVSVALLDSARTFAGGQERDDLLGERMASAVASAPAGSLVLALVGNVHSRATPGVPWDAAYRPAGVAVAQRWPARTLSLLLTNPPGEAWTCSGGEPESCHARPLGGRSDGEPGHVELFAAPREGHHGSFHLPALTASAPAVSPR